MKHMPFIDKLAITFTVVALALGASISEPFHFVPPAIVTIAQGERSAEIASDLENAHVIRSAVAFRAVVSLLGGQDIKAGDYYFTEPLSLFQVVSRIDNADFGFTSVKVTFPEGSTVKQMANILSANLPDFDSADFLATASTSEGYLFPDTYFFPSNVLPPEVITTMENTFDQKIATIQDQIAAFGEPQNDVVIMASILEEEAATPTDRKIIAGILWKRLTLGIPLEVDSTLRYVTGKTSSELTASDLELDNPYNTYRYRGLPPTPISNPGLESLTDAVSPTMTAYLYFLSDSSGTIHYATTLAEQDANEQEYLK